MPFDDKQFGRKEIIAQAQEDGAGITFHSVHEDKGSQRTANSNILHGHIEQMNNAELKGAAQSKQDGQAIAYPRGKALPGITDHRQSLSEQAKDRDLHGSMSTKNSPFLGKPESGQLDKSKARDFNLKAQDNVRHIYLEGEQTYRVVLDLDGDGKTDQWCEARSLSWCLPEETSSGHSSGPIEQIKENGVVDDSPITTDVSFHFQGMMRFKTKVSQGTLAGQDVVVEFAVKDFPLIYPEPNGTQMRRHYSPAVTVLGKIVDSSSLGDGEALFDGNLEKR